MGLGLLPGIYGFSTYLLERGKWMKPFGMSRRESGYGLGFADSATLFLFQLFNFLNMSNIHSAGFLSGRSLRMP
jgi:hypothetical protein